MMNETKFCQSCAMPMGETDEMYGTEADGSKSADYCRYCYSEGKFSKEETMQEMIESCIPFMVEDHNMTAEEARAQMNEYMPKLKRWA